MYEYLQGKLAQKSPISAVIDCGGVGYYVHTPLSTVEKLPKEGTIVKLLIHHAVAEDSVRLFGFLTPIERELFQLFIGISRIGPKIALSALSTLSSHQIISAVLSENSGLISTIPGLGAKSAKRLIIELKDKIGSIDIELEEDSSITQSDAVREAESALLTLGYGRQEIRSVLKEINASELSSEKIIKKAIQLLYRKR
jgi:Holliday junction DNA helicase RuvA